jgi:hypothetical protein
MGLLRYGNTYKNKIVREQLMFALYGIKLN